MSSTKINLKNAREALGKKDYNDALKWAQKVLDWESSNYNALVFAGLAHQNLGNVKEGEAAYKKAIENNPDMPLARQGLINFYEKLERWSEYKVALEENLSFFLESDSKKALELTEKLIDLHTKDDNLPKVIELLQTLLPGSALYEALQEKPDHMETLKRLAAVQEQADKEFFDREVQKRRGRLGAGTAEQVRATVRRELFNQSQLASTYEQMIVLDPASGAALLPKLLDFYIGKMGAVSDRDKDEMRARTLELARALVDQGCEDPTPYEFLIRMTDVAKADAYDTSLQEPFLHYWPEKGLSKLFLAHQKYSAGEPIEDVLELVQEGLELAPDAVYGSLFLCWLYYDSKDYDTGLEYALKGVEQVRAQIAATGAVFGVVRRSFELCSAHCYFNLDSKYAPQAQALYEGILQEDSNSIEALHGIGLVASSQGNHDEANEAFLKILDLDPSNIEARSELGWVAYQQGQHDQAAQLLTETVQVEEPRAVDLYRLGRVYFDMGDEYRQDKQYSFTNLISSAKIDPHFAGAFTYLGHFYRLVEEDHIRAQKCYQKAFSMDASEGEAGLHLCDYYLDQGEDSLAEDVLRAATAADRKATWAWRRLGYAELIHGQFVEAINCFQTSLRNDAKDILAWEGLAESYKHEGRYIAALKAFKRAKDLRPDSVAGIYHVASIYQKLSMYPEAIEQYHHSLSLVAEREEQGKESGEEDRVTSVSSPVPSLLGLAETLLEQSNEFFVGGYYGRAADGCGNALRALQQLLDRDTTLQVAWKLVGDVCMTFRRLSSYVHLCPLDSLAAVMAHAPQDANALLHLPETLDANAFEFVRTQVSTTGSQSLQASSPSLLLDAILAVAGLGYKTANILNENEGELAASYWYDIALSYYARHEHATRQQIHSKDAVTGMEVASKCLMVAIRCFKVSLQLFEADGMIWNALGVATLSLNAKLSQHALIKAIEYDPKNAAPWSNLGFLYLINSELDLARQAFANAQTLDPTLAQGWAGQACLASLWDSGESGALFAHAFESSTASIVEADYGYALQAFKDVVEPDSQRKNLHPSKRTLPSPSSSSASATVLVTPTFALTKYLEQRPSDVAALNLMGLIRERLWQHEAAVECFSRAIAALHKQQEQQIEQADGNESTRRMMMLQHNLGRSLLSTGDFEGSIVAYEESMALATALNGGGQAPPPSVIGTCKHLGAGLAYYYAGQLERSLELFEIALGETEQVAGLESSRDDVVVMLSQVLWALGGEEQRQVAKDELFRCIAQSPRHLPAIFGLCAMGLMQDDETLATAAVQELLKFSRADLAQLDPEMKVDQILAQYYALLTEHRLSLTALAKSVHQSPSEGRLWARLAQFVAEHQRTHLSANAATTLAVARSSLNVLRDRLCESTAGGGGSASGGGGGGAGDASAVIKAEEMAGGLYRVSGSLILADEDRQRAVRGWKNPKKEKLEDEHRKSLAKLQEAVLLAQKAARTAPWDRQAWQVLGCAVQALDVCRATLEVATT
ncbi:Superkiller protein 3 [Actinomortierella ambigua]|uniref:Superkiller protein 3 n=1 Tax=Actinomortierella ambigua TaxID=1343610 RepID=A0A9P6PVT6_9FUNG|nr:Superkiller protein 3 [Actinomortierella ambigua]